jgi:hypothetical protein
MNNVHIVLCSEKWSGSCEMMMCEIGDKLLMSACAEKHKMRVYSTPGMLIHTPVANRC